jgi:DNA modification methylase
VKIEQRKLAEIMPYPGNPRLNDSAVEAVAASIREFGFRQPIVADADGVIICGHTRFKAAERLGLEQVPVHVATDLTPAQIKAYRIADNKTAELAEWDPALLPLELADLQVMEFNLSLLGFAETELAKLLEPDVTPGLCDPDEVPEPPEEPITRTGDLWILGDHRLLCGDSSRPDNVDRLMGGESIQLVNTDPPYNVRLEPRSKNATAGKRSATAGKRKRTSAARSKMRAKDRPLANDFVSDEHFQELLAAWFGNLARVLEPGRAFYIWGGYANCANYPPALKAAGLYFSQSIIWVKQHPVLTRKDFMGNHEWAFYGWREGAAHQFFGPKNAADVWPVHKISPQRMIHLTEKPVELAVRAIQYSSRPGENVLDLFGGSGSTLVAAEQTRRRAFLLELDPPYCDVIVRRWERFTGLKAERQSLAGAA